MLIVESAKTLANTLLPPSMTVARLNEYSVEPAKVTISIGSGRPVLRPLVRLRLRVHHAKRRPLTHSPKDRCASTRCRIALRLETGSTIPALALE